MGGAHATIVVAVDFSADSDAAFGWAVRAARAFRAPLLVLHVAHDPENAPGTYAGSRDGAAVIERVADTRLTEYVAKQREAHPEVAELPGFAARVVSGLPVGRILEVAGNEEAQLIVMGASGRSGLADVLLGSKVERVAGLSRIPVVVVRAEPAPADAAPAD